MEEMPQATLLQRFYESVGFFIVAFFGGLFLSVVEPVLLSLSGSDVSDAIWPYAYRTLQWTLFLRGNLFIFTLGSSLLMFAAFIVLQRHVKGHENPRWANGIGVNLVMIIGERDIESGKIEIKRLADGHIVQSKIELESIDDVVRTLLNTE